MYPLSKTLSWIKSVAIGITTLGITKIMAFLDLVNVVLFWLKLSIKYLTTENPEY